MPIEPIENVPTERLRDMERRYVERGLTEGGPYSLYEIRIELLRRLPKQFDVRHVAERIIELARSNPAQLTTYGALWQVLRPGEPWMGNNSQRIIGNALGQVIAYCHHHRLPILTVLVINAAEGGLTEQAITNIARECRDLGMDTGPNDRDFVDRQVAEARAMTLERLPADPVP